MNCVSFTGIKNIGACAMSRQKDAGHVHVQNCLIAQLSDDFNGRDLSEYEVAVNESVPQRWYASFPEDYRLVHVMTEYVAEPENEFDNPIPKLYLNYREIPVMKKTLPMFSYIAKLTRRISNMEDNEFKRAKDFKYGIIGRLCLIPHIDLASVAQNLNYQFHKFMDEFPYSNKASRQFAEEINKNINTQMKHYLR